MKKTAKRIGLMVLLTIIAVTAVIAFNLPVMQRGKRRKKFPGENLKTFSKKFFKVKL